MGKKDKDRFDLTVLDNRKVKLTPIGLIFLEEVDYEEWAAMAPAMKLIYKGAHWIWGDYLAYGKGRFGERHAQVLDATDWDWGYGHAGNIATTCRNIEYGRRRKDLSFTHHMRLATTKLKSEQQDRVLKKAADEGWSSAELEKQAWKVRIPRQQEKHQFERPMKTIAEKSRSVSRAMRGLIMEMDKEEVESLDGLRTAWMIQDVSEMLKTTKGFLAKCGYDYKTVAEEFLLKDESDIITVTANEPEWDSRMYKGYDTSNPLHGRCPYECVYCLVQHGGVLPVVKEKFYTGDMRGCETWFRGKLDKPKHPKVFLCNLTDLFHDSIPGEFISRVLAKVREDRPEYEWLLLTKNPARYLDFLDEMRPKVSLGATIETNRDTSGISKAPPTRERLEAMCRIKRREGMRLVMSMEPVVDFDPKTMVRWIAKLKPDLVWIGEDNYGQKLREPPRKKLARFIDAVKSLGVAVEMKETKRILGDSDEVDAGSAIRIPAMAEGTGVRADNLLP